MKDLLLEMIEAGNNTNKDLLMSEFVNSCGTACCLCGDLGLKRANGNADRAHTESIDIFRELTDSSREQFGESWVGLSIAAGYVYLREEYAKASGIFTEEELKHPHLTTDHNDRDIAHDYIRLVISKIEEKDNGEG